MSPVLINTESFISFLESVLTSESTVFFYPCFHRKKPEKLKQYEANTLTFLLLFFYCDESSQQKVLESRYFHGIFFTEILEKQQRINLFFHIAVSWRATLLLQRILKSQVVTKCFSLILSWQLCRATISKNTIFSSTVSSATSVDYTVDYIIQHNCGNLLSSVYACKLSLLSLVY